MLIFLQSDMATNGLTRIEKFREKDHLVVPVVMMVEGVHNRLLYTSEELSKFTEAWNGRVVSVRHAYDENGIPVSCNSVDVMEEQVVGFLQKPTFEDGRLKAEAWIDIQVARGTEESILTKLHSGSIMEVSTGVFVEEIAQSGVWEGEEYDAIAINYRPDHLALLPDQVGACSVQDGCGAMRTNKQEVPNKVSKVTILEKIRRLIGMGDGGVVDNEASHERIWSALSSIVSTNSSDSVHHFVIEVFDGYFIYEKWDVEAGKSEFFKQNYSVGEKDAVEVSGLPMSVRRVVSYETNIDPEVKENQDMNKKELVDKIIANGKFEEADRESLLAMSECTLKKLVPNEETPPQKEETPAVNKEEAPIKAEVKIDKDILAMVANTVKEAFKAEMTAFMANQEVSEKDAIATSLAANALCPIKKKEDLMAMSLPSLKALQNSLDAVDFSGRAGAFAVNRDEDNSAPDMPPAVLGLIKQ